MTPTTRKSPKSIHLHGGHRLRIRKKFREHGPQSLTEYELLEMLLYYGIARKNTNEIAHLLLNEFGSIKNVISAPEPLLLKIDGIGEGTATFLSLINYISTKVAEESACEGKVRRLDKLSAVNAFFGEYLCTSYEERLGVALLDGSMKLIDFQIAPVSQASSAGLDFEKIIRSVIERSARNVILAHNHPGKTPRPSAADLEFTSKLEAALALFNVNLIEHVIVCEDHSYPIMRYRLRIMNQTPHEGSLGEEFYNRFYDIPTPVTE